VGLFQQDRGAGTRLGQDPLAAPLGVVGYLAAVGPGVGDAPFGGLLSLGQDVDGLPAGLLRARAAWRKLAGRGGDGRAERHRRSGAGPVPGGRTATEPADLGVEPGPLLQQPGQLILDAFAEVLHVLLVQPAAAQARHAE
jgi:hypothetical protein